MVTASTIRPSGNAASGLHDPRSCEHARNLGRPFVYLGYWIEGARKMRYKNRFMPQERLTSKGWVRFDDG